MKYLGGKFKIKKQLGEFFNKKLKEGQPFIDLFCGSCWITSEIDQNRTVVANDKHKYLITMWREIKGGWVPPDNISEEQYNHIKNNLDENPKLSGFVGFACSFGGKWFGGYARETKGSNNFALKGKKSTLKKMGKMKNTIFTNLDYKELQIPVGAIVYCDIPYKGTTQYSRKEVGNFDHEEFYKWVEENKNKYKIYISEYKENIREGFEIVWEKENTRSLRGNNKKQKTTEILMTPKKGEGGSE